MLPEHCGRWQAVERIARDVFESFGYSEIRTPTFEEALMWLYMAWRNKRVGTAILDEVYNDAGVVIAKATLADAAGEFSKAEYVSGP